MFKVKQIEKWMKDDATRDMIEHLDDVAGHIIEPWKQMTI